MTIYQGDNTAAFGGNLLKINLVYKDGQEIPKITKAELKIGCIYKTFQNPIFPMIINLNEDESSKLQAQNSAYLAVWDEYGRKQTCKGSITFTAQSRRV